LIYLNRMTMHGLANVSYTVKVPRSLNLKTYRL